jgi:stage IV sporulation protein FB
MSRCRHKAKVTVGASFAALLAALLLFDAEGVLAAVMLAAALHEGGHFAALRAFGAPVRSFGVDIFGADIRLEPWERLTYGQEIAAAAAGPAANLAIALLSSWAGAYFFAGVNLALGLFNLLPLRPLDGGRIAYLSLSALCDPVMADRAAHVCTAVCGAALISAIAAYYVLGGRGIAALIPLAWLLCTEAGELGIVKKRRTV